MSLSDNPGRKSPFTYMLEQTLDQYMRQAMFCLPGKITGFNEADQLAQVQCGIQRIVNGQPRTIGVIENVPVLFPGNGEWYFWHEITPGETEGIVLFSQRAMDTWIDQGGPVAPADTRIMSESDAIFIPGVRSRPGAIPGLESSGAGISNYAGGSRVRVSESGVLLEHDGETLRGAINGVVDVIDDTLATLSTDGVTIAGGSSAGVYPLNNAAQYTSLQADLQAAKDAINALLDDGS